MIKPEQLKEVNNRIDAIEEYLKIKEKKMQLAEEELKTQDPGFWDDPKKAEIQMKAIRSLKYWVATFDTLKSSYEDLEVLNDFAKDGDGDDAELKEHYNTLLEEVDALELKNMGI